MTVRSFSIAGREPSARATELVDSSLRALVASAVAFMASGHVCIVPSGNASTIGDGATPGLAAAFGPVAPPALARFVLRAVTLCVAEA